MARTCKRGHEMVGDNILVIGVAKQTRCRTCFDDYQRNRRRRKAPSSDRTPPRAPLDPAVLADLRRQVGLDPRTGRAAKS